MHVSIKSSDIQLNNQPFTLSYGPLQAVHQALRAWYEIHGRKDLPWRNTDDPYHVYISETMLQQTQVQTVLARFYTPFLTRFPSLASLKEASLEEVLQYWQGLGYYNRARYLHETAIQTAPSLPGEVEQLQSLPGIGKNTAHAILAFGFRKAYPVMEANLKRILHRLVAMPSLSEKALWELAWQFLDKDDPFTYNQAMMDIGSLVCTKTNPSCVVCPLNSVCVGKNDPLFYPAPKQKKAKPVVQKRIYVLWQQGRGNSAGYVWIKKRKTRFLHGLYGFFEQDKEALPLPGPYEKIGEVTQHYSHFTLQAELWWGIETEAMEGEWKPWEDIGLLPMSKADEKIVALVKSIKTL